MDGGGACVPRINAGMLNGYIGKTIRIVGAVDNVDSTCARIQAIDRATVTINTSTVGSDPFRGASFVEVVGQVEPNASVKAFEVFNFGTDLDMDLMNEVVTSLHQKMPQLIQQSR